MSFDAPDLFRASGISHDDLCTAFEMRMRLIAMQIRQYTHMYGFSPELQRVAQHLQVAIRA